MATSAQAQTQASINGLLSQLGMGSVQGRMPRIEPLTPMAPTAQATVDALAGGSSGVGVPALGRTPRLQPLQATRLPVAGPQLPPPVNLGGVGNMPGAYPNVNALAAQAANVGSTAAKAGGIAGRLGSAVVRPEATGVMRYVRPGLGMRGLLGAAGYAGAGLTVSSLLNGLPGETNAEQALQGAATGAGIGAMAGSIVPVLGTGTGAVVGGVIGGAAGILGNMFGDKKEGFSFDKVATLMSESGIDTETQAGLQGLYELEKEALGDEAAKANLLQRADGYIQQQMMAQEQNAISAQQQQQMLATQALAGQFFAPFAEKMVSSAQQRYQAMQQMLPSLPESFRGIAASQAADALDNATRMATAYQAQAQMIPAMTAFQDQQQQVNSLAQQLLQQGIQNTLTPQTTDLSALLQGAGK